MLLLLVLAVGAHLVGLIAYTSTSMQHVDALRDWSGRPADTGARTWLLIGSDSRSDLTRAERARLHVGTTEGQRTDTILLLSTPSDGEPLLVSLPRDSYVDVPGHGKDKLNAAYAYGGAPLLVQTVEAATGVHVDSVAEIGFGGIVDLTDAVGGVETCVPRRMVDEKAGLDVRKGCQEFDGATALAWVRARYSDPKGDLGRVERQRDYIRSLVGAVASPGVLLRPDRQWRVARAGVDSVAVDGAGPLDLLRLGRAVQGLRPEGQLTVPLSSSATSTSSGSVVIWDATEASILFNRLTG